MAVCVAVVATMACSGSPKSPTAPTVPPPQTGNPPTGQDPPGGGGTPPSPTPNPQPPPASPFAPSGETVRVLAVADVGMCTERASVEATAALVDRLPGELLLAGDLAYMQGTIQNFTECFDPAWGKFRNRWRPVPGNHEYETAGAAGYRQYFGDTAGPVGRTYYAFRTGDWLVIMIDSSDAVRAGSAQYEFVRTTLAATPAPCTMAVWHHPLFTSGPNGPQPFMRDMWRLLYDNHADVIIAGHDHLYERFGKQDVDGRSDVRGLRQFIVGTGGARLYDFQRQEANSQARVRAHGVLQLTLAPNGYQWAFLDTAGTTRDTGADGCH
jgi:acid phosphatase type 7